VFLIILFLFIIRRTTQKLRKLTIICTIGLGLAMISAMLDMDAVQSTGLIPEYVPPILISISLTILAMSLKTLVFVLIEFYTGKKDCLIHKGLIDGKIFYCPKCLVSYCEKCFNSVIKQENKCWSCNTPFKEVEIGKEEVKPEEPIEIPLSEEKHKKK
jgi:hypothetical protein